MAHPLQKRSQVYALLLTGSSTRYAAKETGIPLSTVKRWRRQCVAEYGASLAGIRSQVRETLRYSLKMALKKG